MEENWKGNENFMVQKKKTEYTTEWRKQLDHITGIKHLSDYENTKTS